MLFIMIHHKNGLGIKLELEIALRMELWIKIGIELVICIGPIWDRDRG